MTVDPTASDFQDKPAKQPAKDSCQADAPGAYQFTSGELAQAINYLSKEVQVLHQVSKHLTGQLESFLGRTQDQSGEVVGLLGDILSEKQEIRCQLGDTNGHLQSLAGQLRPIQKDPGALVPCSPAAPATSNQPNMMQDSSSDSSSSNSESTVSSRSHLSKASQQSQKSQQARPEGKATVPCCEDAVSLSPDRGLRQQLASLGRGSAAASCPPQKTATRRRGKPPSQPWAREAGYR